jgi:hypothetical protein
VHVSRADVRRGAVRTETCASASIARAFCMFAGILKVLNGLPEGRKGGSCGGILKATPGAVDARGADTERFRRFGFVVWVYAKKINES